MTMVSVDFDIVHHNDLGPDCLRNITPYLDLSESLGAPLIRFCIKKDQDFVAARAAAEEAATLGLRLAHQCHAESLFETVDQIIESLNRIDHPNFGLVFEAANLEECRQPYGPETIRKLAPWIVNVYLQNQRLNPKGRLRSTPGPMVQCHLMSFRLRNPVASTSGPSFRGCVRLAMTER